MRLGLHRFLLSALAGVALTACTTWDIALMNHKGKHINDIVAAWGPPARIQPDPNLPVGHLVYTYSSSGRIEWNEAIGSYSAPSIAVGGVNTGTIYARRSAIGSCFTSLYVDERGIVVGGDLVKDKGVHCEHFW